MISHLKRFIEHLPFYKKIFLRCGFVSSISKLKGLEIQDIKIEFSQRALISNQRKVVIE